MLQPFRKQIWKACFPGNFARNLFKCFLWYLFVELLPTCVTFWKSMKSARRDINLLETGTRSYCINCFIILLLMKGNTSLSVIKYQRQHISRLTCRIFRIFWHWYNLSTMRNWCVLLVDYFSTTSILTIYDAKTRIYYIATSMTIRTKIKYF